ncbi:NAD(P)-binding domain-containing protein [Zoogloea sp. LCSB751]
MSNIAFLGLGAMGSRMGTRLLQAGHQFSVGIAHPLLAKHWPN